MKRLSILGSTGSIGTTTLGVVDRFPERFEIVALAGGRNVDRLAEQVRRHRPRIVGVGDEAGARELRAKLAGIDCEVVPGLEGLVATATADGANLVVAGLVGALGLRPTLAALEAGIDVALANKETLVVAGELVTRVASRSGATLLPLDSEHNAIFQALAGNRREDVRRIVLTASGGPFLTATPDDLARATREEALNHPTWRMGEKITIDSATLMNKGLEVIEARWLFGFPSAQIDVVVHPQSVVHSMVEYTDGSVLAQLGVPDMAIPISYVLGHPERLPLPDLPRLDLAAVSSLTFAEPDTRRFRCLALAYRALEAGGTMPAVLNAANEVAVARFLRSEIRFLQIAETIERVMDGHSAGPAATLEGVLDADRAARATAERWLTRAA